MDENKKVVFSTDTKVWINRIIEILELHKKCYPEKYGNIDTNKTKSYVSKEKIIVAYQEDNWESAICEFPTYWLHHLNDDIILNIVRNKKS
jgi:NADH:ubiquinone oxidoreductase subunit